ncbi:hypothetical protein D3C72_2233460 [compost metagenome]
MCGNTEGRVHRAITAIGPTPFDDFEEETLAEGAAVDLEIFAIVVAVIKNARGPQRIGKLRLQPETGFQIIVIIA